MSSASAPPRNSRRTSRREALADVTVVLGCSAAYVLASFAGVRIGWIMPVVAAVLAAYGWFVLQHRGETWRDFGVRGDNLLRSGVFVGLWTALLTVAMLGWAIAEGAALWSAELAIMLPLYPAWGFIQQFVFQGLLHRRFIQLLGRFVALAATAAAFGLVHIDDWRVAALTTFAGLGWSYCYQREPNIWLLGLSHGVLAALAYPLVLAENPVGRLF